jgi:hypothetical protein
MTHGPQDVEAQGRAKWPIFVGSFLGAASSIALSKLVPHVDEPSRQMIVVLACAAISTLLILGIYRLTRS